MVKMVQQQLKTRVKVMEPGQQSGMVSEIVRLMEQVIVTGTDSGFEQQRQPQPRSKKVTMRRKVEMSEKVMWLRTEQQSEMVMEPMWLKLRPIETWRWICLAILRWRATPTWIGSHLPNGKVTLS